MEELKEKWNKLNATLKNMKRVAVAFSAGVDSTLLLKAAYEALGEDVIAITGNFISFPNRENQEAKLFCQALGVKQIVIDIDQMAIKGFSNNPPERCYLCKKALFSQFLTVAKENGCSFVVEGANADDVNDYRPGMKAVEELGIQSPLRDVGLTKREIRALSEKLGLPTWNKPSFACLATRFPYNECITPEKISMVDKAEQLLLDCGFHQERVRIHGNIARIEIEQSQFSKIIEPKVIETIVQKFHELGFLYVTLDLNGYVTGSMNKTLN